MSHFSHPRLSRRKLLTSAVATAGFTALPVLQTASDDALDGRSVHLRVAPGSTRLVPDPYGETSVWCYNGSVPGPEIRDRKSVV